MALCLVEFYNLLIFHMTNICSVFQMYCIQHCTLPQAEAGKEMQVEFVDIQVYWREFLNIST